MAFSQSITDRVGKVSAVSAVQEYLNKFDWLLCDGSDPGDGNRPSSVGLSPMVPQNPQDWLVVAGIMRRLLLFGMRVQIRLVRRQ